MTEHLWNVPSSWEWTVIKELGDVVSGGTPSTKVSEYWGGNVIWFAPSDLAGYKPKFIARGAKTLTDKGLIKSSARVMPAGSVMFSSRAPVGYVVINSKPAATNQGFKSIVPHSELFNEYVYYYLKAAKHIAEERATGTTFKELSGAAFGALPVPIAPANEQRRIVERIEALFEGIDKGVESLRAAKRAIGLYCKSLLKAAFEGRLTAAWRAENPDKIESPETLLARIREERDKQYQSALRGWEQDLAEWKKGGENGRKPTKPKEPKLETTQPLISVISHSELPKEWVDVKLVAVMDIFSGSTPKGIESCRGTEVPFFKISDMNVEGNNRFLAKASLNLSMDEVRKYGLTVFPANTTVFPRRGGAILTNKKRRLKQTSCLDTNTMGLANNTETILQDFPWFWVLGLDLATIYNGSNVPQINNNNVEPLSFPICSPAEQAEIVRILDARLEVADKLNEEIDAALDCAVTLRQSILKKAFAGQLAPQYPADEPASTLLARIGSERAEVPARRNSKRRKT